MDWSWIDWLAVAVLGGAVGARELVSRYKDDPGASIKSRPAAFYIAIKAGASIAALGLIHKMSQFSGTSRWAQILLAGVSAMAFFRTYFFVVRVGDLDVGIGPNGLVFLGFARVPALRIPRQASGEGPASLPVPVGQSRTP